MSLDSASSHSHEVTPPLYLVCDYPTYRPVPGGCFSTTPAGIGLWHLHCSTFLRLPGCTASKQAIRISKTPKDKSPSRQPAGRYSDPHTGSPAGPCSALGSTLWKTPPAVPTAHPDPDLEDILAGTDEKKGCTAASLPMLRAVVVRSHTHPPRFEETLVACRLELLKFHRADHTPGATFVRPT